MVKTEKKLEIIKKYYLRKKNGETDFEHPYDIIMEVNKKGLYFVLVNGHVGYINDEGEFLVPINYDYIRTNYKGETSYVYPDWYNCDDDTSITYVCKDNGIGIINNRGEELVPCEFEDVQIFSWTTSKNFIQVALPSSDNSKLVWGLYDIKNKRVSVIPQYEVINQEEKEYASFKENGKWGILHCATGIVVVPAIYVLIDKNVPDNDVVIALLGESLEEENRHVVKVAPRGCQILVLNGTEKAQIVVSGYDWISRSGPSVMKGWIGSEHAPKKEDNFKILKMPNYIGIVRDASYEAGYFLEESGEFVKKWTVGCTTKSIQIHAKYLSGGLFTAKTYDGKSIPVTEEMQQEILKRISEE